MIPKLHYQEFRLTNKREKKRLKRLRKKGGISSKRKTHYRIRHFQRNFDRKIIENYQNKIFNYFNQINFLEGACKQSKIEIPTDFSFSTNYENSIDIIKDVIVSFYYQAGSILEISFKKCKSLDQLALFTLGVIILEFENFFNKLHEKLIVTSSRVKVKIIASDIDLVNKMLFVNGLLLETEVRKEGLMPFRGIGYIVGKQRQSHYAENKKGANVTRIRSFLNDCLLDHGFYLNKEGENEMDGLLSEILNNGEDHSPLHNYYVTASSFIEVHQDEDEDFVGEVNLTVLNFGYSIYQGFEEAKENNIENYIYVEELYDQIKDSIDPINTSRENLFTLYALQPGVSRLKFQDESRGNGTMKFLNSFFALGDFEDLNKGYCPKMTILSGKTMLICNNKYRPFKKGDQNYLSLNTEKSFSKPPDPKNLKKLLTQYPGTILDIKIYLSKGHLKKKSNDDQ